MFQQSSLKSYGRFNCNQYFMFYQLILTPKQYLIRFYNSEGKLKIVRSLKIPTEAIQIHSAGPYLLCYLHYIIEPKDSEIFMVKLDTCRLETLNCQLNLPCKTEENRAISLTNWIEETGQILFTDLDQNLYLLKMEGTELKCKNLYKNNKIVSRIQTNKDNNIVLVSEEFQIKTLFFKWGNDEVVDVKVTLGYSDYFCQNGFQVKLFNNYSRQEIQNNQADNELQLQYGQSSYTYGLKRDSKLLFYSESNKMIMIFCPKQNLLLQLIQGIFKVYQPDQDQGRTIPKQLKDNNFLVGYKKDNYSNIQVELRLYNQISGSFKTQCYCIPDLGNQNTNLSFLKKNIEYVIMLNGLIDPIYDSLVHQGLKELEEMEEDFEVSVQLKEENGESYLNKATRLIREGLQHFPKQMFKIIQKMKVHAAHNLAVLYTFETKRFFEHCLKIQAEVANQLESIAQSIEKTQGREATSSFQSHQQRRLGQLSRILENMVNFYSLMMNQLQIELKQMNRCDNLKPISQQLSVNQVVLDGAKSLFLMVHLLQDKKIYLKIETMLVELNKKKQMLTDAWYQKYPNMAILQYSPLMLHQHFRGFEQLSPNRRPTFMEFVSHFLFNKHRLIEMVYFYQLVSRKKSTPYIDSDVSDLMQNVHTHIQPLRQLNPQDEEVNCSKLLHKMAGTALRLGEMSVSRYLIQLSVYYYQPALTLLLIHSNTFSASTEDNFLKYHHYFSIKSLLLTGMFNQSYLYVLKHHSKQLYLDFLDLCKVNGNLHNLLALKLEKKLLQDDDQSMLRWLQSPRQREENIENLLSKLEAE